MTTWDVKKRLVLGIQKKIGKGFVIIKSLPSGVRTLNV